MRREGGTNGQTEGGKEGGKEGRREGGRRVAAVPRHNFPLGSYISFSCPVLLLLCPPLKGVAWVGF